MFKDMIVSVIGSLIWEVLKAVFDMEPFYKSIGTIRKGLGKQVQKAVKATLRAAFTWFG